LSRGHGWIIPDDLPAEAKRDAGEQEVVYNLNLGEQAMPEPPRPLHPLLGFVAGTPILTAEGPKPIEQVQPGDLILTRPDDEQGGEPRAIDNQEGDGPDPEPPWWERN
jgi:hypothetical protein